MNEKGFSLLECVIAIAILATVVGSMISMQGTIARILQFSTEKEKAGIELRSIMAQFEYVTNVKGQKSLPKVDKSTEWTSKFDKTFKDKVSMLKSEVKLSQFLTSAIKIYYLGSENAPNTDNFKWVGDMLDNAISTQLTEPSFNAEISVSWLFGKETKNLVERIFLMNNEAIESLKIPKLPAAPAP